MPASIRCALAGVTTGEWTQTLRDIFGEFRAPTGIGGAAAARAVNGEAARALEELRARVRKSAATLGRPLKVLIGKPGLDGHSNGAEQIAVWCRDAGMEVVYEGIRLSPEQIVTSVRDEGVHLVGLSILSGSHLRLVPRGAHRVAGGGPQRHSGCGWRHYSRGRRGRFATGRRRAGLHPEGF